MKSAYAQLYELINHSFRDETLLAEALTHSSWANERQTAVNHNERLEFLGDAVMQIIISDYLFSQNPPMSEGEMTRRRASLVCEASFANAARGARLGEYLRLGKGEITCGGANKPSILADAFEAVIGAVYLDGGMAAARAAALKLLPDINEPGYHIRSHKDPKSVLQEITQKNGEPPLRYCIIHEEGPPHNKLFTVAVFLKEKQIGAGKGKSRKEAEQAAAAEGIAAYSGSSPKNAPL